MAGITFINYIVDTMLYKTNPSFNKELLKNIEINEEVEAEIALRKDEKMAVVTITAELDENPRVPFSFKVTIVGYFEYNEEEAEEISFTKFLKTNAIAILYPYLRSIVSDLTGKSNVFPNYNMPVTNISRELEETDKIKIIEL